MALRFVVGAHFFHEGYTKWRDPKPFSAPVFSAAKGPAANFYHGLVWDKDGLFRLDKETTFRIAHMGEIQMEDIERLLAAMEEYLKK